MRQRACLGRTVRPRTAVSTLGFRNARQAPPSKASNQYFGLGENLTVAGRLPSTGTRGAVGGSADADCLWDVAQWGRPISADELVTARDAVGRAAGAVLTGRVFPDTAVKNRAVR